MILCFCYSQNHCYCKLSRVNECRNNNINGTGWPTIKPWGTSVFGICRIIEKINCKNQSVFTELLRNGLKNNPKLWLMTQRVKSQTLYKEAESSDFLQSKGPVCSCRAACQLVKELPSPPPRNTFAMSDLGGLCPTISVTLWNWWSDIHTHFLWWLACCAEVRKEPGIELLCLDLSFHSYQNYSQSLFKCTT